MNSGPQPSSASPDEPFASTDANRVAGPLAYAQYAVFEQGLELSRGGQLQPVQCAYETWGKLNPQASNAVLICHALSGDSHAASHHSDDDPGWWEDLIGPGKAIDTDRYFVVCPNVLGGCRGSTGPEDKHPETGKHFGADFPNITIDDMVALQQVLAEHLGIKRWRAIIGGSLGGHQAMTWIHRQPDCTDLCVIVASSPRLTSQALGFDIIGRNAIQTDPHFRDGQYYDYPERPDTGLAIARMLGHVTYLSNEAMESKFGHDRHDPREIATDFEQRFSVGSYLAHQGQKFTSRFDANSYIAITMAMDLFDLGSERKLLCETFAEADCEFLLVSFSSDWLFPPHQSREIVNALTTLDKPVSYAEITSPRGHDSFLIAEDVAQYAPLIQAKLGDLTAADFQLSQVEKIIVDEIPEGASVLDLGCGDGRLLAELKRRGHQRVVGVEVQQENLLSAGRRGLDVIDYDLNEGLPAFGVDQFDIVVMNETLQVVPNIERLVDEMMRVGKQVIVSFPNFAYRSLREAYAKGGRSPKAPGRFSYEWYNTPNRRFPSIADVEELCQQKGLTIEKAIYFDNALNTQIAADNDPNLNADTAVMVLSRL